MTKPKKPTPRRSKPKTSTPKPKQSNTDHLDASALDASQPLKDARQERFVVNLAMHGMSNGQAYILAGYAVTDVSVGSAAASRLLKDVRVQSRLTFLQNRAAALAIDAAQVSKSDVLNMTFEQHQRNIGVRPVTITTTIKSGKDKGKQVTIETFAYNEHAASQTLKLLHDEFGLGQGASGARGEGTDTIEARATLKDPEVIEGLANLQRTRKLILAGGTDTEKPAPAKPSAEDLEKLRKIAEG